MARARWIVAAAALAAALGIGGGSAGARSAEFVYFRMPSGNIFCAYIKLSGTPTHLRCEIRSKLRPMPPRPAACRDAAWGEGYSMGRFGRPRVLCITDTIYDPSAWTFQYGRTWRRDTFTCTSRTTGLRCTNGSAHSFFLSRERSYTF